jgi:catechol 2,3-dioxygenase-like lactoylglutathione lyase family enzyme
MPGQQLQRQLAGIGRKIIMTIQKLDHVNIRTAQLDTLIKWYSDILGLNQGPRPDFSFPGAWLYAHDSAVVHLVGTEGRPGTGSEAPLKLEHFAFSASDRDQFERHLNVMDVPYRIAEIKDFRLVQYNLSDPDGNHIHVDFAVDELPTLQHV